jgi:hypothetical protein
MNMQRRGFVAGAAALAAARPAQAQAYPTRPIEMIVAFPAGGGTDVGARSIARVMEKHLGPNARLGVINRHGAGGEVGWTALAQSRPDGYTIGFINAPAIVAMTIEKQTRFQMDSFDPIGNVITDPNVLLVHRDSAFRTVADFIDNAKANPGTFTVGSSGAPGNSEHLALLQIQVRTQTRYNFAPFNGTAPLKSAILGRHVPAAILSISEVLQEAREGRIPHPGHHDRTAPPLDARHRDLPRAGHRPGVEPVARDRGAEGHAGAGTCRAARGAGQGGGRPRISRAGGTLAGADRLPRRGRPGGNAARDAGGSRAGLAVDSLAVTRRAAERGFLLLLLVTAGALLPEALSYRGGSQYFPVILLAALLACCLAALFRRRAATPEDAEPFFQNAPRAGLALLLMAAYTLALPVVGYFTTSAALMFVMAWVFGYRNLRVIVATIVGYLLFTWLVFTVIFERDMAREFFMPWILGY